MVGRVERMAGGGLREACHGRRAVRRLKPTKHGFPSAHAHNELLAPEANLVPITAFSAVPHSVHIHPLAVTDSALTPELTKPDPVLMLACAASDPAPKVLALAHTCSLD